MHAPALLSSLVEDMARERLRWFPEIGVGFYPVRAPIYDDSYFEKYAGYAETDMGKAITAFRVDFVNRHVGRGFPVVDNGIGCGDFILTRDGMAQSPFTYGFDVNPRGVEWLRATRRLVNPYVRRVDALTMWDVLEHIEDFRGLLANVAEWLFVSIPVFRDCDHVLRSRHYRKDEHFWYFTHDGFLTVMRWCGFHLVEHSLEESNLGRQDIVTFAMQRNMV